MNKKIKKLLASVMAAVMILTVIPFSGINLGVLFAPKASAANAPTLSLNLVADEGNTATVVVKLESGNFTAIDFQIKGTSDKIVKCTKIKDANDFRDFYFELEDNEGSAVTAYYSNTGKYSACVTEPFSKAGGEVAVYTFEKTSADKITNEDLTLVVNSCESNGKPSTAIVVNNLPEPSAETNLTYNGLKYKINGNEAILIGYEDYLSGVVVIPEKINGYLVTSIGIDAFSGCTGLTSITIPNSVTSISDYAFWNCTGLTSITIPESVTSIGYEAFEYCDNLEDVYYSGTKEQWNKISIGEENECLLYANIHFYSITGTYNGLKYEINNNEVTITGYDDSLPSAVVIPERIDGCPVTNIGASAFEGCTGLTSITISDSVIDIAWFAFYGCSNLTNVKIPDSVTIIHFMTFCDCTSLTSVTIPDSVTEIYEYAFEGCSSLKSLTIGKGLSEMSRRAFLGCSDLISINISSENKVFDSRNNCNAIIETATNELVVGCKNTIIPNSVTSIGAYSFAFNESLSSVVIPDSVTIIGTGAFDGCTGLTSVTIPDSVTVIFDGAFYDCDNLEDVYYSGTEEQWNKISIGEENECLLNANIHFNYSPQTHTHTLSHIVVPATCTVNGMEYDICTDCGETFNTVVIPAAHKYKHVIEESTCTKAGTEYDICTVCGAKANVKTLPLKAHSYEHITIPSTCTVAGMEYDICSECGNTANSKTLPLAAHTWGEWVRTKEPTVDAEGVDTRECSVCHAKETRAVEKLKALVDENTGVQVVYDDEYSSGVKLEVEESFDGTSFQLINSNYGSVNSVIFDITTTKNGEKVQPDGKVTVRIPVPEGFSGGKIFAVYVDSVNGKTESIPATVVDGYVEFTVEHFSKYALCWEKGSVKSVSLGNDIELKYKDSAKLNPEIESDSGVKYKVEYKSSDNKIATVDNNGNVYGAKAWGKKTATITCTVTDEYGNQVSDSANVTCGYAWWQWIIGIVLFGWIWY